MPDDWDGPPAAQGLPARRRPGGVQGRRDPAAGHSGGRTSDATRPTTRRYDPYAGSRETTEGRVYTVTGGDWDTSSSAPTRTTTSGIVVNMGPQHPSTHGVLRLILELEGETVTEARVGHRLPAHRHREEHSSTAPGPRASPS